MKLLLDRSQYGSAIFSLVPLRFGGSVAFRLHALLETTEEEDKLLNYYQFKGSTLIASDPAQDLARAYKPAAFLGLIAFMLMIFFLTGQRYRSIESIVFASVTPLIVGIGVTIVMTFFYFGALRNYVRVKDLLGTGRHFYCHSVIELVAKEAELKRLCNALHATVETSRNWGEREIFDIPAQIPSTMQDERSPLEGWGML